MTAYDLNEELLRRRESVRQPADRYHIGMRWQLRQAASGAPHRQ